MKCAWVNKIQYVVIYEARKTMIREFIFSKKPLDCKMNERKIKNRSKKDKKMENKRG
jgi:hypothetical protein